MSIAQSRSTVNSTTGASFSFRIYLSDTFRFWYYLIFIIISIIGYLIIFTYILTKKIERQGLHNHATLIVLFLAFCLVTFDYPLTLNTVRNSGLTKVQNTFFCQIWWLLDFGFYNSCTVVLAWASFERHILIFHTALVQTKHRRIFVHYLPMVSIVLYLSIFYVYVIFFPPCQNIYDFNVWLCGGTPCYSNISFLIQWERIVHGSTSTVLIVFFNVTLLFRVFWQKRNRRQDWKKCRQMVFQLLSISVLFLSLNLPIMIIILVQKNRVSNWAALELGFLVFFSTLIHFLLPYICLASQPTIWRKVKLFFRCNARQVAHLAIQ